MAKKKWSTQKKVLVGGGVVVGLGFIALSFMSDEGNFVTDTFEKIGDIFKKKDTKPIPQTIK